MPQPIMDGTKYSALAAVTVPALDDEWGVNQGGVSKKINAAQVFSHYPTIFAHMQAGATYKDQMDAAIAACPVSGGIVDARGIVGNQSLTDPIIVDRPALILLGRGEIDCEVSPGFLFNSDAEGAELVGFNNKKTIVKTANQLNFVLVSCETTEGIKIRNIGFSGNSVNEDPASPVVGVDIDQSVACEVTGCVFEDLNIGVRMIDTTVASTNPKDNWVHHNVFKNAYGLTNSGYGVLNVRSKNTIIHDNTMSPGPFERHGIYLSAATRNTIVHDNFVENCRLAPIQLNTFTAGAPSADFAFGVSIHHNIIYGANTSVAFAGGIYVTGGCNRISIDNNQIYDAGEHGIQCLSSSASSTMYDVSITNNLIYNAQNWGIICFDINRSHLTNNRVIDCSAVGLNQAGGIRISLSQQIAADNNKISGNTSRSANCSYGLVIGAGTSGNVVTDNDLRGNSLASISDSGTGTLFDGNKTDDATNKVSQNQTFTDDVSIEGTVGINATPHATYKLHIKGGSTNQLFLDNTGERYTEIDFGNNGTAKTGIYWDNTDGRFVVSTSSAGPTQFLNGGLMIGAPTGGDKGAGSINIAADIYKNNTAFTNPDYVFEHYFKRPVSSKTYKGLMALSSLRKFVAKNNCLPDAHKKSGMFARADFLLEKVEQLVLYVLELDARISRLEK